jgi:outer membrane receptor protein involved in Fe transport
VATGDLWTSFSYSQQGKVWDSLTAIRNNNSDDPDDVAASLDFLIPEYRYSTFQVGFTSDSGWSSTLVVRNVFDDDSYSYLSSTSYGDIFGDPRFHHIRNLQRPLSYYVNFTKKW